KNAFNCVSRQAFLDEVATRFPSLFPFVSLCYGASSVLLFGDRRLASTSGVQQGDPLGPLLFCLAIHPVLRRISEECPGLESNSWYLDDGWLRDHPLMSCAPSPSSRLRARLAVWCSTPLSQRCGHPPVSTRRKWPTFGTF